MIPCYSEFRAYALIRQYLNLSDECVSTKLGVTGNHVLVSLASPFLSIYIYIYIYSITYHEFGDCSMGIHVFYMYTVSTGQVKNHVVDTVHIKKLTILCEESA